MLLAVAIASALGVTEPPKPDFIVVGSNDPTVTVGQTFAGGQHIQVKPPRTISFMRMTGEVLNMKMTSASFELPIVDHRPSYDLRMVALEALVIGRPPAGRTLKKRSKPCPAADQLTDLDKILQADADGCTRASREALGNYLTKTGVVESEVSDTETAPEQ